MKWDCYMILLRLSEHRFYHITLLNAKYEIRDFRYIKKLSFITYKFRVRLKYRQVKNVYHLHSYSMFGYVVNVTIKSL